MLLVVARTGAAVPSLALQRSEMASHTAQCALLVAILGMMHPMFIRASLMPDSVTPCAPYRLDSAVDSVAARVANFLLGPELSRRAALETPTYPDGDITAKYTANRRQECGTSLRMSIGAVDDSPCAGASAAQAGYALWMDDAAGELRLVASDAHWLRDGAARALRELGVTADGYFAAPLDAGWHACSRELPRWATLRGHQFTDWAFAFQPWPAAAEQYVRDLIVFGTNQVEFAHIDWARGDLAKLVTYSEMLGSLGLNVSVWYPLNMWTEEGGEQRTMEMLKGMPHFDSMFVPGGDGGEVLAPVPFLKAVEGIANATRAVHPGAAVWVSAQEYSTANMTAFWNAVAQPSVRSWLTGIAYGPHVRVPLTEFLESVPAGYVVRQYPDLCHTLLTQFPVPDWDPAFAWTHRRQAINPSPRRYHNIETLRENATYVAGANEGKLIGFGAYSEGTNDDLNKVIYSAATLDGSSVGDIVKQYATHFFGSAASSAAVDGLFGLERNWQGPLQSSRQQSTVSATLAAWRRVVAATAASAAVNWRLQAYHYRAVFDAYVAGRVQFDMSILMQARQALAQAGAPTGPAAALQSAAKILATTDTSVVQTELLAEARALATALNKSIGASVLQAQQPDLGLTSIDINVSDVGYLAAQVEAALKLPTAALQLAAIENMMAMGVPPPSGFLDELGSPDSQCRAHLQPGEGQVADPSFYFTPLQVAADAPTSSMPVAWQTAAHPFFDAEMVVKYTGLEPGTAYNLTVVRWGYSEPPTSGHIRSKARLTANGVMIHDYQVAPVPMEPQDFVVPATVVGNGTLVLAWSMPPLQGGNGEGCFVSTVILQPAV